MRSSSNTEPVRFAAERAARSALPALVDMLMRLFAELRGAGSACSSPPLVPVPLPARATRRLVARGELAARKIGRTWFARPADIERLIPAARPEPGEPANDGTELTPEDGEDGAERLLQDILEPRGLRLRGSVRASSKSPSAPRRGAVQVSTGRGRQ